MRALSKWWRRGCLPFSSAIGGSDRPPPPGATGRTDHSALRLLYDLLAALPAERVPAYQPYWVTRAALLCHLGRSAEAEAARRRAIGLTDDPAIRTFLEED